ncbi:MAG: hypothetical protein EBX97_04640 [Actinobacteria bacterium]|jgi:hypothetical protein|nr:hypothetical protein [Actinomycetota bacterium]
MKKASPALWILVPLSLIFAAGSIWATFHFGPTGSKAYTKEQCDSLKTFILDEELAGKADWTIYKKQVGEYLGLNPEVNRSTIVDSMATSVVKVLEHDLKIYERLNRFPSCLLSTRKDELPGLIDETRSAIEYLRESFDSTTGEWNTDFYADYMSATQFLKSQKETNSAKSSS